MEKGCVSSRHSLLVFDFSITTEGLQARERERRGGAGRKKIWLISLNGERRQKEL